MKRGLLFLVLLGGCGNSGRTGAVLDDAGADGGSGSTTIGLDASGLDAAALDTLGGSVDAAARAYTDTAIDTGALPPDAAVVACKVPGPCDPFGPNTCPMGQICRSTNGIAACLKQVGTIKAEGDLCLGSDCDQGLTCLPDDDGKTRCFRACAKGSRGSCGPDKRCAIQIGGESCLMACRPQPRACDIYEQSCSDLAQACHPTQDPETARLYTGCQAAGPRAEGQACMRFGDCGRGLFCVSSICRRVCKPDGAPSCTSPQVCTGLSLAYQITFCR